MYILQDEFAKLIEIIEENMMSDHKDLERLCYNWWRVYYCMNSNIKEAKTLKEKAEIVQEFTIFHKQLSSTHTAVMEKYRYKDTEREFDIDRPSIPHKLRQIMQLMRLEQQRLAKNMRDIKREKEGKMTQKRSPLHSKKWLRS